MYFKVSRFSSGMDGIYVGIQFPRDIRRIYKAIHSNFDGAPCHTAGNIKQWFINVTEVPERSPDLSPIETILSNPVRL